MSKENENGNFAKPMLGAVVSDIKDNKIMLLKEHLDNVYGNQNRNWRPCLHDSCPDCLGTGIKRDGGMCIHGISCPCPKCTPSY